MTKQGALRQLDGLQRWCLGRSEVAAQYRAMFKKLRPTVVFSAAPLDPREEIPVVVAKSLGIPTATAILSWDNLTTKNRLACSFDHYFVWSAKMADELQRFYPEVSADQVTISGSPQFDWHFNESFRGTRAEFCRRRNLDPSRPIVVYGGVTPGLMPNEPSVVARLIEDMDAGRIAGRPQLVVRLHPKDDGSRYVEMARRFPAVRFEVPGERSKGNLTAWQPSLDDVRELVSTLAHGDVHINVASTLSIDAALLDRPVINLRYDLRPPGAPLAVGIVGYEYAHYRPIVASGGVRMVDSPDELVAAINLYLSDPSIDRDGRRRIVALECGRVDGGAGKRIAARLLALGADRR